METSHDLPRGGRVRLLGGAAAGPPDRCFATLEEESGVKAWNGLRVAYGKTMGKWMGKKYGNKKPITFEICPITFPNIYEFSHFFQCTKVRQDLALDDRGTSGCSVHGQFILR